MAMEEESKKSPDVKKSENANPLFSPGFRSVAEMAGWDEEALLIASLVVEETPDRNPKQRRRSVLVRNSGTPTPANSRRKRAKAQTSSPMPVTVLNLDEAGCQKEAMDSELSGGKNEIGEPSKAKKFSDLPSSSSSSSPGIHPAEPPPAIPCIEKLREELSCAICLETCFEPSTTPCGHSFCKKCLLSAADKCGKKCPKCRQLISNARSCTVNTVLWNTIQLLFPEEVEARKKAATIAKDAQKQTPAEKNHHHHHVSRNRRVPVLINTPERMNPRGGGAQRRNFGLNGMVSSSRGSDFISVARPGRAQVEEGEDDAALALRLQREEFMGMGSNDGDQQQQHRRRNSLALARANLRAMASRAINIHRRT